MHEIEDKLWPLPIEELLWIGKTSVKLRKLNINTIDLLQLIIMI